MPKIKSKHTDMVWTRVDSIIESILKNERYLQTKRTNELVKKICDNFNIKPRQAFKYIAEAKKEIRIISKNKTEETFAKALWRREYLWLKNRDTDSKFALEILKDTSKLLNHYPEEKIKNENFNMDIDLSQLTEVGLERIKNGDDPRVVLFDTNSIVKNNDD